MNLKIHFFDNGYIINTTAAKILKILSQTDISLFELEVYLNVEKSAILKSIRQINKLLTSINLKTITKKEDNFELNLTRDDWTLFYSKFKILTFEDKVDYLYIKFISNKFINLEYEKEILDISRSTVLRCFKIIKKEFEDSCSEFKYVHGKGIELIRISPKEKLKFFKKLMRFFVEEDLLAISSQEIWKNLNTTSLEKKSKELYFIAKKSKIYMNCFVFSELCSLEICTDIFDEFEMFKDISIKDNQYKKIYNIVEEFGKSFSKNFKYQLTNFIIDFINNSDKFELYLKFRTEQFIDNLINILNIKKCSEELKTILFYKVYNSFFKYENNMLKIKKVYFNTNDNLLLDLINKLLNEKNWNMFYSDKFIIIQLLKQIVIKDNIHDVKNILILFSEFTLKDKKAFRENIMKTLPSINFDIEISCFYTEDLNLENKTYDLIISNENISKDILVVDCFDNTYIQAVIEKEIFEKRMRKLGFL